MNKKLIFIVLIVVLLISSCGTGDEKTNYKITFNDGSKIIVSYKSCFPEDGYIKCYDGKSLGQRPDAVFGDVRSLKKWMNKFYTG